MVQMHYNHSQLALPPHCQVLHPVGMSPDESSERRTLRIPPENGLLSRSCLERQRPIPPQAVPTNQASMRQRIARTCVAQVCAKRFRSIDGVRSIPV